GRGDETAEMSHIRRVDCARRRWCDRCRVSGATGANDYTPTPHEWNRKSHSKLQDDRIQYQTQVEIPVATVDFYFSLESRPLLVFVDDPGPSWNRTDGKGRRTTPAA